MISCWYGAITEPEMRQSSSRNGRRMPASCAVHSASRSRSSSVRTTTPSAPTAAREAREVDLGDEHRRLGEALQAVEVHLGAVGGVVPDDREAAAAGDAHGRLEVGERHEPAAVAGGQHDRRVRACASAAPGTLGKPSPIDWNAVPTIIMRSGDATGQYMFAQPMKCPPSETTTRSSGSSSAIRAAADRGSSRPSGASASPGSYARADAEIHALAPPARRRADRRELVDDRAGDEGGIPADVPADVRVGRRGGEVDLEHARARGEERAEAHRELVERGAEHDGDVGLRDQLHRAPRRRTRRSRRGRTRAAGRSPRPSAVEAVSAPVASARAPSASPAPGDPRAAPGEQERPLGAGERGGGIPDRLRRRTGRAARPARADGVRGPRARARPRARRRRRGSRARWARDRSARARSR